MLSYYIVEDELITSLYISYAITRHGGKVLGHAVDEETAYSDILKLRPDIVFCDLSLNPGSGVDLCKRLSTIEDVSRLKVVLMTGYEITEDFPIHYIKNTIVVSKPLPFMSKIIEKIESL